MEGLKPFVLLGGFNAEELWPLINLVFLTWIPLTLAPRWKHTPSITLFAPIAFSVMYTLGTLSTVIFATDPVEIDFSTLSGVVELFKDPNGVFIGWVHFVVYDALIARWIVMDSVERGASLSVHVLAIIPCLFFALMVGPMGLLIYVSIIRTFLLPASISKKKES